jgi:VanZ like family/Concanavalin A-like lectin/glucanases superfamily
VICLERDKTNLAKPYTGTAHLRVPSPMGIDPGERVYVRTLAVLCAGILCVILSAGLWPFCAPKNDVEWLKSDDGLAFGRHGSVASSGAIRGGDLTNASGTLEIWLEAARSSSNTTILSFDGSAHPGEPFSLHQMGDSLVIRRNNVDSQGVSRTALFFVERIFHKNKQPVFVTVTLNSRGASVYQNGILTEVFPLSGTWNDLTGRIVLANSPTANNSWPGKIFGLAIYRQELTASQIAADYASWMKRRKSGLAAGGGAVAVYLFDEHDGTVAHNSLDPATDLTIPTRYFILHPGFMLAPWSEYRPDWGYWKDIGVNIAGFVPFGFCVFAYLSSMRVIRRPGATTVLLGFFASFTIEFLQAFLPTRNSGTTDLITNTLGTAIGVMVCLSPIAQTVLMKAKAIIARGSLAGREVQSPVES